MMFPLRFYRLLAVACWMFAIGFTESPLALGHGSALDPMSRVLRVRNSNPENPSFQLGQNAVAMDGKSSYYTWNQVSQNIPQAVQAGLPAGFDYSPWVPDGHLASGGRFAGNVEGLLYEGLDQVSADWPTTPVDAGSTINVDYHATARLMQAITPCGNRSTATARLGPDRSDRSAGACHLGAWVTGGLHGWPRPKTPGR